MRNKITSELTEALRFAISRNDIAAIEGCLTNPKADLNVIDKYGRLPIMTAINTDDINLIEWLIEKGASVSIYDKFEHTSLHYACNVGKLEVIKTLIKMGADVNGKGYHSFAKELEANAERLKFTPLHYAVTRGHYEITEFLLENGANATALADGEFTSPLHYLRCYHNIPQSKKIAIMELLLKYGAFRVLQNKDSSNYNCTLLHYAAKDGELEVAKMLLKHGAHVNVMDIRGKTPLHYAMVSLQCSEEVRSWIMQQDEANKNSDDCDYSLISKSRAIKMIELLLKNGANTKICSYYQMSSLRVALDSSFRCNCHEIVELLQEKKLIKGKGEVKSNGQTTSN